MADADNAPPRLVFRAARQPHLVAPVGSVFRIGRHSRDPFSVPPATFAGRSRFDAPDRRFQTLYAASTAVAAYGEIIAHHRASLEELSAANTTIDTPHANEAVPVWVPDALRSVPRHWLEDRHIGATTIDPSLRFADLVHSNTIQALRPALASFLTSRQIADLDMATLFSADRAVTQHIASYLHRLHDTDSQPLVAGIRYPSRLHLGWECWALFADRLQYGPVQTSAIQPDDPSLLEACRVLNLEIAAAG